MQVKKFEALTLQEALESVKRELGPEAIILQTKQNKKAFGLMSKPSVEVTAAVSERSLQKRKFIESRMDEANQEKLRASPAKNQAEIVERAIEKHLDASRAKQAPRATAPAQATSQSPSQAQSTASTRSQAAAMMAANYAASSASHAPHASPSSSRKITATRYADILDDESAPSRSEQIDRAAYSKNPVPRAPEIRTTPPSSIAHAVPSAVLDELQRLKSMIGELQTGQGAESSGIQALAGGSRYSSPAAQDAYETLVLNGVEKRFSQDLLRRALAVIPPSASENPDAVLDQLATEMLSDIQVKEFFPKPMRSPEKGSAPRVVALVGPTGVGKTTTLAKIASLASLTHGLKVGLINLDTYRVAAVDQLSTYARIMNVPFRTATNAEELGMALRDFASRDLVLIDTTGRSQKDIRALQEMKEMLSQVPGLACQLVVSATTRDAELVEIGKRFAIFSPEAAVFSKLDEAITYGPLYNFPKKTGLPLAFFAIGQRVPEDIEEATPERVASLVLDIG